MVICFSGLLLHRCLAVSFSLSLFLSLSLSLSLLCWIIVASAQSLARDLYSLSPPTPHSPSLLCFFRWLLSRRWVSLSLSLSLLTLDDAWWRSAAGTTLDGSTTLGNEAPKGGWKLGQKKYGGNYGGDIWRQIWQKTSFRVELEGGGFCHVCLHIFFHHILGRQTEIWRQIWRKICRSRSWDYGPKSSKHKKVLDFTSTCSTLRFSHHPMAHTSFALW